MKGYIVRGKDDRGNGVESKMVDDVGVAVGARETLVRGRCTDVRIYAVAEDGETPLPTYEEALAEIERLRAMVLAFAGTARLKSDADGWCNIVAELQPFDALRAEREALRGGGGR